MSNIYKLCPTHFPKGAKIFLMGSSPPLVTGLQKCLQKQKIMPWLTEQDDVINITLPPPPGGGIFC